MKLAQADQRLTAERDEVKYLLDAAEARDLSVQAADALDEHAYTGEGANRLPGARHYITTVYFDTDARDIFRASLEGDSHTKVRAREYYDDHPDLVELATDPRELIRYNPVVWIEIKERDGGVTRKRRFGLPKADVPSFFARGEITPAMIELAEREHGAAAKDVLEQMQALRRRFARPLRAVCLVNYQRHAWQAPRGHLRLTLDRSLAVFRPPDDLWTRRTPLVRSSLGPRVLDLRERVLEVKSKADWPAWLAQFLAGRPTAQLPGAPGVRFSKFLLASRATDA